jgi:rRNA-processing protein FCF1
LPQQAAGCQQQHPWTRIANPPRTHRPLPAMRVKKLKAARKTMEFFRIHFGIRAPYKLVVDGTFLHAAHKLPAHEQIQRLLQGELTIYTTGSVRHELEQLGEPVAGALEMARTLATLKCGHPGTPEGPMTARDSIRRLVGATNHKKYIVASTDTELMDELRVREWHEEGAWVCMCVCMCLLVVIVRGLRGSCVGSFPLPRRQRPRQVAVSLWCVRSGRRKS